jgi:predicted lipoprotein with Yx(FWY)xxD motif
MHARFKLGGVAIVAAGTLALAACGGGGKSTTAQVQPAAASASSAPAASSSPASSPTSPTATVKVATTAIGPVLVSADGLTLYRFDKDTGTGSNCNGACAQAWPPLIATSTPTGWAGLGVVTRADGRLQVTYQGHPLYHYAGDGQPGDTTGDGFGGIWHAVHPAAKAAAATPATPATTTGASGSYGY